MITQEELDYIGERVKEGLQQGTMESEGRKVKWFLQITEE